MTDYMVNYFLSFFQNPGATGIYLAVSVALAIGFGAVWLSCYWPPLSKKPWLWAVLIGSAFLTVAAICFIQTPLQLWVGRALSHFWSQDILVHWILLAAIPQILLTGLAQEGAKLVPVVIYWRHNCKNIDPKLGLAIGAVAGAGFAVFEAQWTHTQLFALDWTWEMVQDYGFWTLAVFWERFFTVAAHIAFSALAGYGLARGRGWHYYLIASVLHALLNYGAVLYRAEVLPASSVYVEIYIAVVAVAVTGWALWLRWRKGEARAQPERETGIRTETEISTP